MVIGIGWSLIAGLLLGVFALPSKYVKNYAWENTWGAFFFLAMLIVPVAFMALVVKGLWSTYAEVPPLLILAVVALGFMWGCGNSCWGQGISSIGLSLAFYLMIGTCTLVGSLLPFFLSAGTKAASPAGMTVLVGIFICILGVAAGGYAGMQREKSQSSTESLNRPKGKSMLKGIVICVVGGVLASGCNIGFHVGGNIAHIAQISQDNFGNTPWVAGIAIWMPIFIGGLISSFGFPVILLTKNNTWRNFSKEGSGRNLLFTLLMALFHDASLFCYGYAAWKLGTLGTSVGFAIFEVGSIIVASCLGLFTGEWKGASAKSKGWMALGLAVLVLGIIVISIGNAMFASA